MPKLSGLLVEKKDEDLFYIQKAKSNDVQQSQQEIKKKKLKLEDKLKNLNCYRHLKPDPISAPPLVTNQDLNPPKRRSKRQQKLTLHKANLNDKKSQLNKNKLNTNNKTIVDKTNKQIVDVSFETSFGTNSWKKGLTIMF